MMIFILLIGSTRDWSHITKQIGMFCYSGLNPEQVSSVCHPLPNTETMIYIIRLKGYEQNLLST